jgi:hypothetical protein
LARDHGCETVAFPAISCGVYGYPLDAAAEVSRAAVRRFLDDNPLPAVVRWVMFDSAAYEAWMRVLGRPTIDYPTTRVGRITALHAHERRPPCGLTGNLGSRTIPCRVTGRAELPVTGAVCSAPSGWAAADGSFDAPLGQVFVAPVPAFLDTVHP